MLEQASRKLTDSAWQPSASSEDSLGSSPLSCLARSDGASGPDRGRGREPHLCAQRPNNVLLHVLAHVLWQIHPSKAQLVPAEHRPPFLIGLASDEREVHSRCRRAGRRTPRRQARCSSSWGRTRRLRRTACASSSAPARPNCAASSSGTCWACAGARPSAGSSPAPRPRSAGRCPFPWLS